MLLTDGMYDADNIKNLTCYIWAKKKQKKPKS